MKKNDRLILAIDLGKYKSVACVYAPASSAGGGQERTLSFETTAAALTRLVRREAPAVVVIEACALAGWVSDLCAELGVPCQVANTAAEAWSPRQTVCKRASAESWVGVTFLPSA